MKEFDVWHLTVAERGFLRLVVYPEDDTGFANKATTSGIKVVCGGASKTQDLSGCGRQEDK